MGDTSVKLGVFEAVACYDQNVLLLSSVHKKVQKPLAPVSTPHALNTISPSKRNQGSTEEQPIQGPRLK